MFNFACGIALGAAFSPFWIGLFNMAKVSALGVKIAALFGKK